MSTMVESQDIEASASVGPAALEARRLRTAERQAAQASGRPDWLRRNAYFYDLMARAFAFFVEPGERVLNVRCQTGWMLKAVRPSEGVGVELTDEMIAVAARENPQFRYIKGFPESAAVEGVFDSIIVADPGEIVDVQAALQSLRRRCHRSTRLYIYGYNPLWENLLKLAESAGLKMRLPELNWLTDFDYRCLLELSGFELVKTHRLALLPVRVPLLSWLANTVLAALPGLRRLCLIQVLVARPVPEARDPAGCSVSVVIPCRNEEGNIRPAVERLPELGSRTEIIFCDDRSTDGTRAEIESVIRENPGRDIRLVEGPGICKSRNVWAGFDAAKNDIVLILDADLAVMPEEMPRFVEALALNRGEFINGSRLVYPVPRLAMKTANRAGNVAFSWLFSLLLGQRIKDTLCGTKALWRSDWLRLRKYVDYWGMADRWGDYDLLLGAALLNLRIVDLPVHYQERVAGVSKMTRVLHNARIMLTIMFRAALKMRSYGPR